MAPWPSPTTRREAAAIPLGSPRSEPGARERDRRRRERDPEGSRASARERTARSRARQVAHGLTFTQILTRCREAAGVSIGAIGDPASSGSS
jgi:hypothetical protein